MSVQWKLQGKKALNDHKCFFLKLKVVGLLGLEPRTKGL